MKYVIAICGLLLVVASFATSLSMPDARSRVPVLYWVTDNNPERIKQARRFQQWLKDNHYPPFELRLDTSNSDQQKKIIQGVSGVAGDIIDVGTNELGYFHAIGLFDDVTDDAKKMGFSVDQTYPAIGANLTIDGRQYLFPCNVGCMLYFVNKSTFKKFSQPLPPNRWTFDEFESLGKQFVAAANSNPRRPEYFFADTVDREVMRRSLGLSVFNETLTRSILDDPRHVQVLKLIAKWTNEDHILPSAADKSSYATAEGYGGAATQLFNDGHYAMLNGGRYLVIQFRKFHPPPDLGWSEPPNGGFPNVSIGMRSAGVYAASKHKDLARYFLKFLASEEYNMNIVEDGDGLPPNPAFTQVEQYLRPPQYPNEWDCQAAFAKEISTNAIPSAGSPFVLFSVATRIDTALYNGMMSGLYTAEFAAFECQKRINQEIDLTLSEQPELRERYDKLVARQKQIDDLRRRGEKVPATWIENPFYRSYYRAMGWSTEKAGT